MTVVYFNHLSECYVEAEKMFTGSFTACEKYLEKKGHPISYGICNDFEGEAINANYVQCYELD